MDYQEKYLKYKIKYLNLKQQQGGICMSAGCGAFKKLQDIKNNKADEEILRLRFEFPRINIDIELNLLKNNIYIENDNTICLYDNYKYFCVSKDKKVLTSDYKLYYIVFPVPLNNEIIKYIMPAIRDITKLRDYNAPKDVMDIYNSIKNENLIDKYNKEISDKRARCKAISSQEITGTDLTTISALIRDSQNTINELREAKQALRNQRSEIRRPTSHDTIMKENEDRTKLSTKIQVIEDELYRENNIIDELYMKKCNLEIKEIQDKVKELSSNFLYIIDSTISKYSKYINQIDNLIKEKKKKSDEMYNLLSNNSMIYSEPFDQVSTITLVK